MDTEIQQLARQLRLSDGELLCLAREIGEDGELHSVELLAEPQMEQLVQALRLIARP